MQKIDFYILAGDGNRARERFACKLTEKAYHLQNNIYINVDSSASADSMNDLLWTFRDGSFIPHELYSEHTNHCPVVIGHDVNPVLKFDVLINITSQVPDFYQQFERIVEIVANDDIQRQQARQRFKIYRSQGIEPTSHQV